MIKMRMLLIIFCLNIFFLSSGFADPSQIAKTSIASSRQLKKLHMLVVFTKFKGESPGNELPPVWANTLFNGLPGSVNHYYDAVSFGQFNITGEYLPKIYELPYVADYYPGKLSEYVDDVLKLTDLDPSVDFSLYDNDGPDGIPGTRDDDGFVDFIVMMPISRPFGFISKYATGTSQLMMDKTFYTRNMNKENQFIKINNESGCIATGQYKSQAVGIICHEFCHSFGTQDLNDTSFDNDANDSAGVGYWCLMSTGLLGWNNAGGPVAPSAFIRMFLGIIGNNNDGLVDIYGIHKGLRLSDVSMPGGKVYRLWVNEGEYFMIEHRRNDGVYYDRDTPKNGLLIWHIYTRMYNNSQERLKLCDLECADGLYEDAGYPMGTIKNTFSGGDNLDFWAHNEEYTKQYNGNQGDATDVFDGIRFKNFGPDTNPSSNSAYEGTYTGVRVYNIHPEGSEMVFDVDAPPVYDWNKEKFPMIGSAYQRYNIKETTAPKASALYLLDMNDSTDVLLSVYNDHIEKDFVSKSDEFAMQGIILNRLVSENDDGLNLQIIRENTSAEYLSNVLGKMNERPFEQEQIPRNVQKITIEKEQGNNPSGIFLKQNYPNPFNSVTTISYNISQASLIVLEVYNILGQNVRTINRGVEYPGFHSVQFNAGELSSGIYFYRISGQVVSETKKFLLIR